MIQDFRFREHHAWLFGVLLISAAILLSSGIHYLVFQLYAKAKGKEPARRATHLKHLRKPARWLFIVTAALVALPALPIPARFHDPSLLVFELALIAALTWLAVSLIYMLEELLLRRYGMDGQDSLRARRLRTQMVVFRRLAVGFIILVGMGVALATSNTQLWRAGAGLLASAGVASLVLAAAAKSTASNILAGLQIAISEPIRIDDVVIVEGEQGRVEEITSSFVIIKLWDLRRMIVPLSYFIEKPFQNWTRDNADLRGSAFLYVDYSVPVEPLRRELQRILEASPLWDGRWVRLQVTNLTDRTMELRCVVSARNSDDLFDLRCVVREQMIAFVARNYPTRLPFTRQRSLAHGPDDEPGDGPGQEDGTGQADEQQDLAHDRQFAARHDV